MSYLEEEIRSWRASLEASQTLTREDLDELECHVREDVEDLRSRGLVESEALWLAFRRTGDPVALATEYHKVNPGLPWARKWYLMSIGFVLFTAAWQAAGIATVLGVTALARVRPERDFLLVAHLVMTLGGVAILAGTVLTSASNRRGIVANGSRRVVGWLERHPAVCLLTLGLATAYMAVGAYAALMGDLWRYLSFKGTLPAEGVLLLWMVGPLLLIWRLARRSQRVPG